MLGFLGAFLALAGLELADAFFLALFGPAFGRRAGLVLARTFFFAASFFFVVFFDGLRFGVSFFCAPVFLMAFFTDFVASFFGRAFRAGEGFFLATAFFAVLERFFLAGLLAGLLAFDRFFVWRRPFAVFFRFAVLVPVPSLPSAPVFFLVVLVVVFFRAFFFMGFLAGFRFEVLELALDLAPALVLVLVLGLVLELVLELVLDLGFDFAIQRSSPS